MSDESFDLELEAFLSEPEKSNKTSKKPRKKDSVDEVEVVEFIKDVVDEPEEPQQTSFLDAASETARTLAQNLGAQALAGYEGIFELIATGDLDNAVNAINQFKNDYGYTTKDKRALEQMANLDEFSRQVPAGLANSMPIPDEYNPAQSIYEKGTLGAAGDTAFEVTGSPLLATAIETGLTVPPIAATRSAITNLPQSQRKQEIARDLQQGQTTGITAGYQLADEKARDAARNQQAKMQLSEDRPEISRPEKIEKTHSMGRLSPGPQRLVKQGFAPSDVASLQKMTKDEAKIASRMASIKKQTNPDTGDSNLGAEPLGEVGKELEKQLKVALNAKKKAGNQLSKVLEDINTLELPLDDIFSAFKQELKRNKVSIETTKDKNGKLVVKANLDDSKFDGDAQTQKAFDSILKRMNRMSMANKPRMRQGQEIPKTKVTAEDLQDIKNLIDYKINYSRKASDQTLSADSERIIKLLRSDINDTLRGASKDYADANDEFSYVIAPLQKLNEATNSKIDVFDDNINPEKLGLEARIVAQNNTRSIDLGDAFDDLYEMVSENGYNTNVNLKNLVDFNYSLNDRFGSMGGRGRGSFAPLIESSTVNSLKNRDVGGLWQSTKNAAGKLDNRTTEGAFNELMKYLNKRSK